MTGSLLVPTFASPTLQSGTGAAPQGMFTNVMIPLTATSPSQPQAAKTQ